jgi:3(or 17)beta-hydroxysteroid dehydrogenase
MQKLNNKVALVTGGASGLGRAIAQRLARDGAQVVITDLQTELGAARAEESGVRFLHQDVADEARWSEVIRAVEADFGRLDVLVNNAGILGPMNGAATPEDTSLADWRRIFAVNVEGVFLGCRAAIPAMRRVGGGSIINISSIAGLRASPHATAYGASKATVRQLTKSIAQHCAQEKLNIRCNSVHPGTVRTALWDNQALERARKSGVSLETIVAETRSRIPLGELQCPEDTAAAVAFLASDDARYITGTKLIVDGGSVSCDTFLYNWKPRS